MVKKILSIVSITAVSLFSSAQTAGTLTFTFTEVAQSSTYNNQGKHAIAVWIQTGSGTFVKTKLRRAGAGNGTSDHLPTWAVNSGGTSSNCMSTNCNTTSASTGATLTSFAQRSITWDGTDVSGNVVPDGTYRVAIEETWNHGTTGTTVRYINFTKGPSADVQSPAADTHFSGLSLAWNPSAAGIEENDSKKGVKIYPNPSSTGVFNVEFDGADKIKVVNVLGVTVLEEKIPSGVSKHVVDLSKYSNGVYFISLTDEGKTTEHRVVVNK